VGIYPLCTIGLAAPSSPPRRSPSPLCPLDNSPNHTVHQIKENVLLLAEEECQLHTLLYRFHFRFLTFLFLLFISTRRSTTHSRPHSPHTSLATPTCKPLSFSVSLPPPNPHHSLQFLAIPPRTYPAPTINHRPLFAPQQAPTPHPPTHLPQMVSLHSPPNSCHRNTNRLPPNRNHPLRNNNNSPGLSIHGPRVA